MKASLQSRLEKLASRLEELAAELRLIAAADAAVTPGKPSQARTRYRAVDDGLIEHLRSLGREGARVKLATQSHKELGGLLRRVGGSSEEAKRSKEHIIQQILYRVFDFSARHALLKGKEDVGNREGGAV